MRPPRLLRITVDLSAVNEFAALDMLRGMCSVGGDDLLTLAGQGVVSIRQVRGKKGAEPTSKTDEGSSATQTTPLVTGARPSGGPTWDLSKA